MYAAEQLLQKLSWQDLFYTLRSISDEDCYLQDFLDDALLEDFLYMLDVYDVIYIASNDRIILTSKGQRLFQYLCSKFSLEKL